MTGRVLGKRGLLVAFSGVDYAGKSTQIALLEAHLAAQSRSPCVRWFRPGYGPELDALRRLVRTVRPGVIPPPGLNRERERTFRRRGVGEAWVAMACLDTLLQYALKARCQLQRGEAVICDRYLRDAIIDLDLRFPEVMKRIGSKVRCVLNFCPKPDVQFLLMLDEATVAERLELKQEPFPDSAATRGSRLDAYRQWAAEGSAVILDARRAQEDIHAEVLGILARMGVCHASQ